MGTIADGRAVCIELTQKMDGCQSRENSLHGSDGRFDPVWLTGGPQRKRTEKERSDERT